MFTQSEVPIMKIVMMIIIGLCSIVLPVLLASLYVKKKKNCSILWFFGGVIAYIISPYILKKAVNTIVLVLASFKNQYVYALYIAFLTTIFEEMVRSIVIIKIMRKDQLFNNIFLFGLGFGAFESYIKLGSSMISYSFTSIVFNMGKLISLFSSGDSVGMYDALLTSLVNTSLSEYFMILFEMLLIIVFQILISLLMYILINKKKHLIFIPFLIHFIMTFCITALTNYMNSLIIIIIIASINLLIYLYITYQKKLVDYY